MTNIFNKTVLVKNGTLIGNWYEENILREKTGEGRTLPGKHIPKKSLNFDTELKNTNVRENTFSRTLGERLETVFKTTNENYGKFSDSSKYRSTGIKEKIFDDFFRSYISKEQEEKTKIDESIKNLRFYDSTNKHHHKAMPVDESSIGVRHMMTQDNIPILPNQVDNLFMAEHKMSKFPNILTNKQSEDYVNNYVPYYKDKEVTFWSMNLDKGNMWKSQMSGQNAFAKSSGFTQPIQNSKGVNQFHGNVSNQSSSKNVYLNPDDISFMDKYSKKILNRGSKDMMPDIEEKIKRICVEKGWLGLRMLRIFLCNLLKKSHTCMIDKINFKFYFTHFGIFFNDIELEFIYEKYDLNRKNEINIDVFLDNFGSCSENRQIWISSFYEEVKNKEDSLISFKKLEKIFNADTHPEVLYRNKVSPNIRFDYLTSWANLKQDDRINKEGFIKFFVDVSTCVENDDFFAACLRSCGMLSL